MLAALSLTACRGMRSEEEPSEVPGNGDVLAEYPVESPTPTDVPIPDPTPTSTPAPTPVVPTIVVSDNDHVIFMPRVEYIDANDRTCPLASLLFSSLLYTVEIPGEPPTTHFVGALASDLPEVSENGLIWTFNIMDGLYFSNGTPLNASSFISGGGMLNAIRHEDATAIVSAPSRLALQLNLSAPIQFHIGLGLFNLAALPDGVANLININYVAETASFGPYRIERFAPGEGFVLIRNPFYPNAFIHEFDRVIILFNN